MFKRMETFRYTLNQDRMGFFELIRHADGASAYFQGDDADLWRRNMNTLEYTNANDDKRLRHAFNFLCEGYDGVLRHHSFA